MSSLKTYNFNLRSLTVLEKQRIIIFTIVGIILWSMDDFGRNTNDFII